MKKELSYADIAYRVLKEATDTRSLHYKVIAKRAYQSKLLSEDNVIVAGNISSAINSEIRKAKLTEKEDRFVSYGKGKYGLTENEPVGIFKDIRNKNNAVKEKLLQSLMNMPPLSFEELVGKALQCLGFENIEVTKKSGDGGIDVMGELVVAGAIRTKICVQVKRWRNNVQRSSISELRGSLRPHQTGLFITTSDFSKPAIKEANDPYKAPISLINGKEFVDILCSFGIGVTLEEVTVYDIDKDNDFTSITPDTEITEKGIEIFAKYKGNDYYAVYFSPTKIVYEGIVYSSPSAAGTHVQGGQPVNGWRFWKYVDENNGNTYPIDNLRNK